MKVWKSFAGEHSAHLKIIGSFKVKDDAYKAANFFNELININNKTTEDEIGLSDELYELSKKHNFTDFKEQDAIDSELFESLIPDSEKITVYTNETDIQIIIKTFLRWGARIEVYSHDEDK